MVLVNIGLMVQGSLCQRQRDSLAGLFSVRESSGQMVFTAELDLKTGSMVLVVRG